MVPAREDEAAQGVGLGIAGRQAQGFGEGGLSAPVFSNGNVQLGQPDPGKAMTE